MALISFSVACGAKVTRCQHELWCPALQVQSNRVKGQCSEAKNRFWVLVLRTAGWQGSGSTE